jgi:hypothetical protein
LNDGYAKSYKELLESTDWKGYGHASGNPKCRDCMVHCGFEPTAVLESTRNFRNMLVSLKVWADWRAPRRWNSLPPAPTKIMSSQSEVKTSGRILIVDDDPEFRVVAQNLVELEGFDTTLAANGTEARQNLQGARF